MTLSGFRTKYNGKRISGYSASGGQCVDECRQYMREVFGWSRSKIYGAVPAGNANTWFANANTKYFRKVRNSPSGKPPEGAIVILKHGKYGHVFVAKKGCTTSRLYGFGQNWTLYRKCADEGHPYTECIGWLIRR